VRRQHQHGVALGAALLVAAVSAAAGATTTAGADELPPGGDYGAAAAGCAVTKPAVADHPTNGAGWLGIAQNGLYVEFGELSTVAVPSWDPPPVPAGTTLGSAGRNGKIGAKIPWFRDPRAWGRLRVKGRHLPGGQPLRARYSNHLGRKSEVVPGGMIFSREGCWKIKARSGSARLEAVIWVINLAED
jgi:hypothetical protein